VSGSDAVTGNRAEIERYFKVSSGVIRMVKCPINKNLLEVIVFIEKNLLFGFLHGY
jgi:hypothetical protein